MQGSISNSDVGVILQWIGNHGGEVTRTEYVEHEAISWIKEFKDPIF